MSKSFEHHKRYEYCRTRLQYRQGKQLKAVKVYTIANESQHLLIFGVPKINLQQELKQNVQRFGRLEFIKCATEELSKTIELELFTDVFHVKFTQLNDARRAKRLLDARQFYGGILHISYAPEYESLQECRQKLQNRVREVNKRIQINTKVESKQKKVE